MQVHHAFQYFLRDDSNWDFLLVVEHLNCHIHQNTRRHPYPQIYPYIARRLITFSLYYMYNILDLN